MPSIRVSDATYLAIAELSILPFRSTATRQLDNTWLVPVDTDMHAAIEAQLLPGDSNDDVIQSLVHQHHGRPLNWSPQLAAADQRHADEDKTPAERHL